MKVSRQDVITDKIVDFSWEPKRFIKLPIDKYLSELGIKPVAPQMALVNAINAPKYRFVCAALSRRLGKTYIANIIEPIVVMNKLLE